MYKLAIFGAFRVVNPLWKIGASLFIMQSPQSSESGGGMMAQCQPIYSRESSFRGMILQVFPDILTVVVVSPLLIVW